MRIAVATFGSEGDARPYLALTRRLRAQGADAYLVAPEMHGPRAREHGVPFVASGPPWDEQAGLVGLGKVMRTRDPLLQTRVLFKWLLPEMLRAVPGTLAALAGADLVVHHEVDIPAFAAAVKLGKRRFAAQLFHSTLACADEIPTGHDLGPALNGLFTRYVRFMFTRVSNAPFRQVFAAAGVPAPRRIFLESSEGAELRLLAVSPSFVPRDRLWPPQVVQTGYWFLESDQYTPPPALDAFVRGGPPPVVITFGSMKGADTRTLERAIVTALGETGVRAVLQAGWAQLGHGLELPPAVMRVDYVPHDWLFAHASCVVHHGGAGTTASVLRAGVPQIVVWHLGDQISWGNLAHKRGVAPRKAKYHRSLTARWLERALRDAPACAPRARELAARIRAEDGVGEAAAAILRAAQKP